MSKRLSIHMLVKNGSKTVERAIEPFAGIADEIVFTDTGSTDGTPELIGELGKKYNIETHGILTDEITYPFIYRELGFDRWITETLGTSFLFDWAAARNLSLDKCAGKYIIKMDVDDQLISSKENILKILEFMDMNEQIDFVMCPYSVATFPRVEEVPIEYSTMYTRFWRNKPEIRFREKIHENVDWARNITNYIMTNDECLVVDRRDASKTRDPWRNFRILATDYSLCSMKGNEPSKHVLLYLLEEASQLLCSELAIPVSDRLLNRKDLSDSDLSLVWLYKGMSLEKSDESPQSLKDNFAAMEAYSISASYGNGRGILKLALMNRILQIDGWQDKLRAALSQCQTKLYPFGASNLEVYKAKQFLKDDKCPS